ncbi:unnamed protein product, partial [Choristocarpus tenellus]
YDPTSHPDVASGQMTPDEALQDMLTIYEQGPNTDGKVSWREFLEYFKDISAAVENDEYFELVMRNAWHISGGEGQAENSSCRRVLVTHFDGAQEVLEVEDDLGIDQNDLGMIQKRLEQQGVQEIATVSLYD